MGQDHPGIAAPAGHAVLVHSGNLRRTHPILAALGHTRAGEACRQLNQKEQSENRGDLMAENREFAITENGKMLTNTVILNWTFTPANYFEVPIEIHRDDYVMTITEGDAEARIETSVFDRDPSIREVIHDTLNDRFLGVQLLNRTPYTLDRSRMVRFDSEGRCTTFIEPLPATLVLRTGTPDIRLAGPGGTIIDTRTERIKKKTALAESVGTHRAKDGLLDALLTSYQASVTDPDNELVHLYEVRDALGKRFGGERLTCKLLRISPADWDQLGRLANKKPLKQGRHRGKNAGVLRDATAAELQTARGIAREMIQTYLNYLDAAAQPGSVKR